MPIVETIAVNKENIRNINFYMTDKKTLLPVILSSIVLFILTLIQFEKLFLQIIPRIENLQFQTTNIGSQFKLGLFFSIIIGLIPILLYLTWRIGRIEIKKRRIFSGLIVITFMTIAIIFRQQLIKLKFQGLINLKTQTGETIYNSLNIEDLHFEYYLFGGLILGCIVSFFSLKTNIR